MSFQRGDKVLFRRTNGTFLGSVLKIEDGQVFITLDNGLPVKCREGSAFLQPAQNKFCKTAIPEDKLAQYRIALPEGKITRQTVRFAPTGEMPSAPTSKLPPTKPATLLEIMHLLYGKNLSGFLLQQKDYVWTYTGGSRSFFDRRWGKIKNLGRFLEIQYREKGTRVVTTIYATYCNGQQLAVVEAKIYENSPASSTYAICLRDLTDEELLPYRAKMSSLQKKLTTRVKAQHITTQQQVVQDAEKRRKKDQELHQAPMQLLPVKNVQRPR